MSKTLLAAAAAAVLTGALSLPAQAQNVAIVNGKPVPKARLDALEAQIKAQAARTGQPIPPEVQGQLREEIIAREVFMQEAQRRDLARKKEYLRRADESCRTVLHQCRAAGGYLGPLPY